MCLLSSAGQKLPPTSPVTAVTGCVLLATVSRKCLPSPTDWCVNRLALVFIYCVVVERVKEREHVLDEIGKVEQDSF